jgi:hypothetical protein
MNGERASERKSLAGALSMSPRLVNKGGCYKRRSTIRNDNAAPTTEARVPLRSILEFATIVVDLAVSTCCSGMPAAVVLCRIY